MDKIYIIVFGYRQYVAEKTRQIITVHILNTQPPNFSDFYEELLLLLYNNTTHCVLQDNLQQYTTILQQKSKFQLWNYLEFFIKIC